eukprot:4027560-Alexandrium_andersonii.AAC.1
MPELLDDARLDERVRGLGAAEEVPDEVGELRGGMRAPVDGGPEVPDRAGKCCTKPSWGECCPKPSWDNARPEARRRRRRKRGR